MALIPCPECKKQISDTASNCPKCGYQLTPEKIAEIKKKQEKHAVGCFIVIVIIVGIILIVYLYAKVTDYFLSPAVKSCISACEKDETLIYLEKHVDFVPVSTCIGQCKKKEGICPASDGSGGPYTGCFVCGATGGKLNCD